MSAPEFTDRITENTGNTQNANGPSSELSNIENSEVRIQEPSGVGVRGTNLGSGNVKETAQEVAYAAEKFGNAASAFKNVPVFKKMAGGMQTVAKGVQAAAKGIETATEITEKIKERGFFDPNRTAKEKFSILIDVLGGKPITSIEDVIDTVGKLSEKSSDILCLSKSIPSIGDKVNGFIIMLQTIKNLSNAFKARRIHSQDVDQSIKDARLTKEVAGILKDEAAAFTKVPGIESAAKTVKVLAALIELNAQIAEEALIQKRENKEGDLGEIILKASMKIMGQRKIEDPVRQRFIERIAKGLDEFGHEIGNKFEQNPTVKKINEFTENLSKKIEESEVGKFFDNLDKKMQETPAFAPLFKNRTSSDDIRIAEQVEIGAEMVNTLCSILKDLPVVGVGFAVGGFTADLTGFSAGVSKELIKIQEQRTQGQQNLNQPLNPQIEQEV